MSSHHAQTALRYMEDPDDNYVAMVHAQLENAEQLERLANMAERLAAGIDGIKSLAEDIANGIERFLSPDGPANAGLKLLLLRFGVNPWDTE